MSKNKLKKCNSCNQEISSKGKVVCPNCGAVNKKPFYKRTWFIVIAIIFGLGFIGSLGDDKTSATDKTEKPTTEVVSVEEESNNKVVEEEKEEIPVAEELLKVTVDELFDQLKDNELKASTTYKDKKIELTGLLSVIDAQGDYIALSPINGGISLNTVLCKLKDEHLDAVMNMKKEQQVTLVGTVTSVGEVLGYSIKVESIISSSDLEIKVTDTDNAAVSENETSEENTSTSAAQNNALRSAKGYLDYTAFSRSGMIKQLEFEGYSTEDSTYGADNCGADWTEQALKSAINYLEYTAFSKDGLRKQLEFEGYSPEEAAYGSENCGADWNEQASKSAKTYLENSSFSRSGLIEQLEFEGFTNDQAVFGVDAAGL